ncbi:probable signal transduction scaffold protein, essential for virulence and fertility [Cephalotrichum gorgonifer]|uniref:Probable signal transduction scaffold protein, essential for virulence and fertility n=1 Tax=Cephalotrichum gorgonifer TaxID=2041049 RepID=A0AAE8MZJ4_9PEZI|nr:probable signal transduction scaffold protein, essential for virulence and fertility [Cephalotrichum gorgonifer]
MVNGGNGGGGEGGQGMQQQHQQQQQQQQQGNVPNRPPGTEYTLQGVMRFLQSEWHRHERERNSWDIEKQEMKARIAQLEGKLKRGDATQNASKKYIKLLQRKLKEQGKRDPADDVHADKDSRSVMIQEKLGSVKEPAEGEVPERAAKPEDESQRKELKSFLDQCQNEFTYLMMTPANPLPPRESPPLPSFDDSREGDGFGMSSAQQQHQLEQHAYALQNRQAQSHQREINSSRPAPVPNHVSSEPIHTSLNSHNRITEVQPQPFPRSSDEPQAPLFAGGQEWSAPASGAGREGEEAQPAQNHVNEPFGATQTGTQGGDNKPPAAESDAWDFSDVGSAPAPQPALTNRPDTDVFPSADTMPKSPNRFASSHRRKSSSSRRKGSENELSLNAANQQADSGNFKWRFGLRGHLDTVRSVIFSGGGSPAEPEICTGSDDGMIKRFHIPRLDSLGSSGVVSDLDVTANFTHRGHSGAVLSLAAWSPSPNFVTGGRAQGDGWIFSGGQDSTIRVWERGRVDPKATLEGHDDAVWGLCVLPGTVFSVFGAAKSSQFGNTDRILLVSGSADGTVKVWAISMPPRLGSPQPGPGPRRPPGSGGRVRGNSMSSGSAFTNGPQASVATNSPFHHTLLHTITRPEGDVSGASPTCIYPLGGGGESFVVSYSDAAILVYDTRTGEQIGSLASMETYDGTMKTSVNAVVATTAGLDQAQHGGALPEEEGSTSAGPTGGKGMAGTGVEGVIISGHEDRFVRFFDANSGQCTYSMWAHPASISSLSLSPDGRELVTSGHDASLRFWSLEKRSCTQEITNHRVMRGEGVCSVVWSPDGKWVVSGGGDGVVKVFARQ